MPYSLVSVPRFDDPQFVPLWEAIRAVRECSYNLIHLESKHVETLVNFGYVSDRGEWKPTAFPLIAVYNRSLEQERNLTRKGQVIAQLKGKDRS